MTEMGELLEQRRLGETEVLRRMYRAPAPRERERWHGVWLLARGWTAAAVGRALERDAHITGQWVEAFAEGGLKALVFEQTGGSPALDVEQREELKVAVQESPSRAGINVSNWNWKVVRQGVAGHFSPTLSRSSCLNLPASIGVCAETYPEAVGQGGPERRATFVGEYAALTATARRTGARIFLADQAHFQADADLRGNWALKG